MVVGAVPALPGAGEVLAAGIVSSLHPANETATAGCVYDVDAARRQPQWRLLLDPQTGQLVPPAGTGCAPPHSAVRRGISILGLAVLPPCLFHSAVKMAQMFLSC